MDITPSADEILRLQVLAHYGLSSASPETAFDTVTALAARLLEAPIAQISIAGSLLSWAKSTVGDYASELARRNALCSRTMLHEGALIVPDTEDAADLEAGLPVTAPEPIRFYAGVPLRTPEGLAIGTLFIADTQPRPLTPAQRDHIESTLQGLAQLVMEQLETRRKLSEAKAEMAKQGRNAELQRNRQQSRSQAVGEEHTCFLTLDRAGRICEWETSAAEFFGYSSAHTLARSLVDLVVPAQWHQRYRRALDICLAAIEGDGADGASEAAGPQADHSIQANTSADTRRRVKMLVLRPTGGTRYIHIHLSQAPLNHAELDGPNGNAQLPGPPLFHAYIRDVDEKEHSQEWLRQLEMVVNNANDAILITEAEPLDEPGPRILYCNEAFVRMSGYTLEEIIGNTPRMLHGAETDPESRAHIRHALRRWKPVLVEIVNYRKDGTPFWVELSIVPVKDETGWWTHWVSIQRDITERKRVEQELQRAYDAAVAARLQAEELRRKADVANRAKSEFLSRMSHELRTPLNAILGFAQLLQMDAQDAQDAEQIESVDHILKGGHHLLQLINEVLDISRIEAGRLDMSLEPIALSDVVGEAVALMTPLATAAGLHLAIAPFDEALSVKADNQRLKQVLLNLLSNAVKYNRAEGSIQVQITAHESMVEIAVRDTGFGLAPERLAALFVPFERLGADRTGVEGTGLGLALSQKLIEAMGGSLQVQSMVGEGSEFKIVLPQANPPAPLLNDGAISSLIAPSGRPPRTVLYVEENTANFTLVQRLFSYRPHIELLVATHGEAGLEMARAHHPDLILLDLHLPDMNGEDVLRRLRWDTGTREIPVMIVSADATPGRLERMLEVGAQAYVSKPINIDHFLETMDALLSRDADHIGSNESPAAPGKTGISLAGPLRVLDEVGT